MPLPGPQVTSSTPPERPDPLPVTWAERLLILALRLSAIAVVAWGLMQIPLPLLDAWLPLRNVFVVLGALIAGGKALFDTFFYERFWP